LGQGRLRRLRGGWGLHQARQAPCRHADAKVPVASSPGLSQCGRFSAMQAPLRDHALQQHAVARQHGAAVVATVSGQPVADTTSGPHGHDWRPEGLPARPLPARAAGRAPGSGARTRRPHARRAVRGEAAHVHLVDDEVLHGQAERAVALPVERRARARQRAGRLRPRARQAQHAGLAVGQVLRRPAGAQPRRFWIRSPHLQRPFRQGVRARLGACAARGRARAGRSAPGRQQRQRCPGSDVRVRGCHRAVPRQAAACPGHGAAAAALCALLITDLRHSRPSRMQRFLLAWPLVPFAKQARRASSYRAGKCARTGPSCPKLRRPMTARA